MTDVEKAKGLFQEAGLPFPTVPEELAERLKDRGKWLFSTREIETSPYLLRHYIREADGVPVEDYVILSHSGHGVNSYALQYYLVYGTLEMFLHLGWGGVYMDNEIAVAEISNCFCLADEIVPVAQTVINQQTGDRLRIVGSNFYGSYWFPPGEGRVGEEADSKSPAEVLAEAHHWLKSPR